MAGSPLAGHLDTLFFKVQLLKLHKLEYFLADPSNARRVSVRFLRAADVDQLEGFPLASEPVSCSRAFFRLLCARWVADEQTYDIMVVDCGEERTVILDSGQLSALCSVGEGLFPSGKDFQDLSRCRWAADDSNWIPPGLNLDRPAMEGDLVVLAGRDGLGKVTAVGRTTGNTSVVSLEGSTELVPASDIRQVVRARDSLVMRGGREARVLAEVDRSTGNVTFEDGAVKHWRDIDASGVRGRRGTVRYDKRQPGDIRFDEQAFEAAF